MLHRMYFVALVSLLPAVAQQPPRIVNARIETRSAAAGLEKEFRNLVDHIAGPAWTGYAVAGIPGRGQICCFSGDHSCTCALEEKKGNFHTTRSGPVSLEGGEELVVLFRIEQKRVQKIRFFSGDCELDAGGRPLYWLTGVRPQESLALLASFVEGADTRAGEQALAAVAHHGDPAADSYMERFVAPGKPDKVRERAVFWLGATRGKRGFEMLRRLVRDDASDRLREKAIFALSVSKEPEAADVMMHSARNDKSARVRGQALFWLAQKAGRKAVSTIAAALENDPETEVKKRAVFALSQLPKDEGVPMLIQVARTNRNPEVRKQAIFWLGQSKDDRALAFFEEILK